MSSRHRAIRATTSLSSCKGEKGTRFLFCGDALAAPGKMWSPYTTDWDHWTDAGLKPTHESLRKLAKLKPSVLLPAHGPVIDKEAVQAREQTAAAVEEVGFLKSFERYTKQRLKEPPSYRFLVRAGRIQRLETVVENLRAPVSDRQYLRPGLEGRACLSGGRSMGSAQRSAAAQAQGGSTARQAGSGAVQPRPFRSLRRRVLSPRARQAEAVDAGSRGGSRGRSVAVARRSSIHVR